MKSNKGKFIVIEGLDGCGKSTQIKLLGNKLINSGKEVLLTEEQTKGAVGRLIVQVLNGKIFLPLDSLQLLFVADRSDHLYQTIEPALKEGKVVICDRYFWSTVAYGSLELDKNWLLKIHRYCRRPDMTIFIDISPEECLKRINKRGDQKDIFEKKEKLIQIRESYFWLMNKFPDTIVIDGEQSILAMADEIFKQINEKIIRS